jgi:hypothetical protein
MLSSAAGLNAQGPGVSSPLMDGGCDEYLTHVAEEEVSADRVVGNVLRVEIVLGNREEEL